MKKTAIKALFLLSAFAIIAACGTRGELKKAPPMWGKAKAEYEAEQAKKAQEAQEAEKESGTKQ